FFSSRRRHTRSKRDWSSDVCSSDLTRDKFLNVQINAKSQNQLNCIESLSLIARKLENLPENAIQSDNDSFKFQKISITSPLSIVAHDDQGYFLYALSISAKITIYEGVEMNC